MYVVTETDSDGDVVNITGPFESEQAVAWMRDRAEKFARKWQDDLGEEPIVKIEFHPSGAFVHADCDPQSFNIVALQTPEVA